MLLAGFWALEFVSCSGSDLRSRFLYRPDDEVRRRSIGLAFRSRREILWPLDWRGCQAIAPFQECETYNMTVNKITGSKVAGACCFIGFVLSRLLSIRSGADRHFAQFSRSPLHP